MTTQEETWTQEDILSYSKIGKSRLRGEKLFERAATLLRQAYSATQLEQKDYLIKADQYNSGHRWGDGGESEKSLAIRLQDTDILAIKLYTSYTTTSDDFIDYGNPAQLRFILFKKDEAVEPIFQQLKQLKAEEKDAY